MNLLPSHCNPQNQSCRDFGSRYAGTRMPVLGKTTPGSRILEVLATATGSAWRMTSTTTTSSFGFSKPPIEWHLRGASRKQILSVVLRRTTAGQLSWAMVSESSADNFERMGGHKSNKSANALVANAASWLRIKWPWVWRSPMVVTEAIDLGWALRPGYDRLQVSASAERSFFATCRPSPGSNGRTSSLLMQGNRPPQPVVSSDYPDPIQSGGPELRAVGVAAGVEPQLVFPISSYE